MKKAAQIWTLSKSTQIYLIIYVTRRYGGLWPLLLTLAEGLGGPSGPLPCRDNLFKEYFPPQENPLTFD